MVKKYLLLFLGVLGLDQLTKYFVQLMAIGQETVIIPGFFSITHVNNRGAGFGILPGEQTFLIIFSVLALVLIYYLFRDAKNVLVKGNFAVLMGGIVGNLIDRIRFGYVIDFFDFKICPVFNIADTAITLSIAILIIFLWKKE